MQNCCIRNGERGPKLAFKLSLVGIKDLNHFVLITLGLSAKFQFILEHDIVYLYSTLVINMLLSVNS